METQIKDGEVQLGRLRKVFYENYYENYILGLAFASNFQHIYVF
jgi:hypothetical protein